MSSLITIPLFGIFGFGIQRFRATRAMSVPQYVEMRYSPRLRVLTGIFNSMAGVFQMLIFPIVGAQFVRVLIGAPETVSLLGLPVQTTWIIMALLLGNVVLFIHFGGSVTMIVTNFFQMIIIMGTIFWLFAYLLSDFGVQQVWSRLEEVKGLAGVYPFTGDAGNYGVQWFLWLVGMSILLQFSFGPYLQQYASMDKPRTARLSTLLGGLFGTGRSFVILGLGVLALAALGPTVPQGVAATAEEWNGMATAYYLAGAVPPVMMGFLLVGLLFADVSTTDHYILSWSTSIVNDCICPFLKKPLPPRKHIRVVKQVIIGLSLLFFLFGIVYRPTIPLWEYQWLCVSIICGTGIAVLAGMYWKRATTAGAYAAVFTCLVLPVVDLVARRVYLAFDKPFPVRPQVTGLWTYLLAGALLVIVSLCSRAPTRYWDLGKAVREMNAEERGKS